jgi:hypothetical protein
MARELYPEPLTHERIVATAAIRAERHRAFAATLDRVAPADGGPTEREAAGFDRPTVRRKDRCGRWCLRSTLHMAYLLVPVAGRAVIEAGKRAARGGGR